MEGAWNCIVSDPYCHTLLARQEGGVARAQGTRRVGYLSIHHLGAQYPVLASAPVRHGITSQYYFSALANQTVQIIPLLSAQVRRSDSGESVTKCNFT